MPSLLHSLLENHDSLSEALPHLDFWVTSGESLPPETFRLFRAALPNCTLLNLYGSSEVAADATCMELNGNAVSQIPIGKPIHNSQVYVLDDGMNLMPAGAKGELYVGGVGLARGYWNKADLTAEKFVPNPFRPDGERLYRTGDFGRWLPDGSLEYLSRRDRQVKLRGFRIELDEIEAVLRKHPKVAQAAVLVCNKNSDTQLVAFVVAQSAATLDIEDVGNYLSAKVPEYMLPSRFVALDEMPLTPSGKIDLEALRLHDVSGSDWMAKYVAPRNEVEQIIADIWAETLHLERVGVEDNFFRVGGHSLLAAQVISRLRKTFNIEVPLSAFFEAPTISRFTQRLNHFKSAAADQRGRAPAISQMANQKLEQILTDMESLSEEEVRQMLQDEQS